MSFELELKNFHLNEKIIEIYIPVPSFVQQRYNEGVMPFPYWSKVWPAAMAMSNYLLKNPHLIKGKKLLELAAGLGLPSITAAVFAQHVICSDYLPESVAIIQQSVRHNNLKNVDVKILNWYNLPADLNTDILLLSDINYEPEAFKWQHALINSFLDKGTQIVLSTPQRLVGKDFIEPLLPFCKQREDLSVMNEGKEVMVHTFLLSRF